MINKGRSIFKNISLAFIANMAGLAASSIITFILPAFIGVTQYSYYQLYIFYASYMGFLGFGWIDGLYLRYGGKYFDKINKNIISAEFRYFTLFEIFLSCLVLIYTLLSLPETNKIIIYCAIAVCIAVYMPRAILHNLLLSTGKIKEYALALIIEKTVQITLVISGIILGKMSFLWFISADISGRFAASIYVYYVCGRFIAAKPCKTSIVLNDIAANIKCGIFLMFSNIASMLIIGVVRQFIEIEWDVETFGRISLTLALSNFILIFISSVSMVLFPIIKRCGKDELVKIYNSIRTVLMLAVLFVLIFHSPLQYIFSLWLPQYGDSLKYTAVLFPICVFESKMNLLINTYYKSQRLERKLLFINISAFVLSLITSFIACRTLHSLDFAVMSVIALLAFRCILAEVILSRSIQIKIKKDILLEVIMTAIFIYLSMYTGRIKSMIIYSFAYIICLIIKRKDILSVIPMKKNG